MFVNVSGWERAIEGKLLPALGTQGCLELLSLSQRSSASLFFIAYGYCPVKAQVQIIEICSLKLKDAKIQGDSSIRLI